VEAGGPPNVVTPLYRRGPPDLTTRDRAWTDVAARLSLWGRCLERGCHDAVIRLLASIALAAAIIPLALFISCGGSAKRTGRCVLLLTHLRTSDCEVVASDTAADADPLPFWGSIECASNARYGYVPTGGDPHATAEGAPQGNTAYRRLSVLDGDNFYGERCELGQNDWRSGPTAFYREGDHLVTFVSYRLPRGFPLSGTEFQVVMQMKQTNPSNNSGGTPVLSLLAQDGRWVLHQSDSPGYSATGRSLWSAPARSGTWTRFAFDVVYSQNPASGSIRVFSDLNGDGDALDAHERSPRFRTFTLKREVPGTSSSGIPPGGSIPSHLRVGIYHATTYPCPPPGGCSIDVDNIQVVNPR
jgi:Polysaccharide lyase